MRVCISRSTRLNIGAQGGNQSKLDRGCWESLSWRLEVHLVLCCVVLCCVVLCCVVLCCVVVAQRALLGRPAYHDPQDWWPPTLSSWASSSPSSSTSIIISIIDSNITICVIYSIFVFLEKHLTRGLLFIVYKLG